MPSRTVVVLCPSTFNVALPSRAAAAMLLAAVLLGCAADQRPAPRDGMPWMQTTLYFGLSRPDGSLVSGTAWDHFVDQEITPRFPDGLTIVQAQGQYRDSSGTVRQEPSRMVVILYPRHGRTQADARLRQIAAAYAAAFNQESVLRADAPAQVWFHP